MPCFGSGSRYHALLERFYFGSGVLGSCMFIFDLMGSWLVTLLFISGGRLLKFWDCVFVRSIARGIGLY